eukprot:478684_1
MSDYKKSNDRHKDKESRHMLPLDLHKNILEIRKNILTIHPYYLSITDQCWIIMMKNIYLKNATLIYLIQRNYIWGKGEQKSLLNLVTQACFHRQKRYSNVSNKFINQIIYAVENPHKADFYLCQDHDKEVDDHYLKKQFKTDINFNCVCVDQCMVTFWLNKSVYHQFLSHPNGINIMSISTLWHRFLMYPQFIKHYFAKNINIFKSFAEIWMVLVQHIVGLNIQAHELKYGDNKVCFKPPSFSFEETFNEGEKRHLMQTLVDLTSFFSHSIKYLQQYHLEMKHMIKVLNVIHDVLAFRRVIEPLIRAVFYCTWNVLYAKYKRYDLIISDYLDHGFLFLPGTEKIKSEQIIMFNPIGDKIRWNVKCGNFVNCGTKWFNVNLESTFMKLCGRCKLIYYCSRKCQKWHWKYSHRLYCK